MHQELMLLMTSNSLLGACHRHEPGLLPQAVALSRLWHVSRYPSYRFAQDCIAQWRADVGASAT